MKHRWAFWDKTIRLESKRGGFCLYSPHYNKDITFVSVCILEKIKKS